MSDRLENYTIAEGFDLPSKGLIYDAKVNPHVELRSMNARDEMKRLSPSTTPLKTLADIIEGCMLEKPVIHVYDMAFGDYEFLLHKLRVVSYGNEYKINFNCSECGEAIETVADLDSLEVKDFNLAEFEALRTFILPDSKKEIKLNFQTPRMLDNIEANTKELKRKMKGSNLNLDSYAQLYAYIDTVDNKKISSTDFDYLLSELTAKDMLKILNSAEKLNSYIGLDTLLTIDCPYCGHANTTFFRFGSEFFRPTNI